MGQAVAERTVLRRNDNGSWETWGDVAHRVAQGNALLYTKDDADYGEFVSLRHHISKATLLMSGRHLQHGDETQPTRNKEVFTNCLHRDTLVATLEHGPVRIADVVGQTVTVKARDGVWRPAKVSSHGRQMLYRYGFDSRNAPAGSDRYEVVATANHRWFLSDGSMTEALAINDELEVASVANKSMDPRAIIHGLVFGDGDALVYVGKFPGIKDLPFTTDPSYIRGFIYGWWLADGSKNGREQMHLSTVRDDAVEWLASYAAFAGYRLSGHSRKIDRKAYPNAKPLNCVVLNESTPVRVKLVEEWGEDEVFCVEEPVTSGFTLANGLLTGNCSTAAASFLSFYLLLNGSGVGRCYDDDMILIDWDNAPNLRVVLSDEHPDFDYSAHETVRDAIHKYGPGSKTVKWFRVPDSREGWAQAVEVWETYAYEKVHRDKMLILDFSGVRPKGSPIAGMQGRPASGPVPLMNAFMKAASLKGSGMEPWRQAMYVDHYFAECVLVGGARRAARMATKHWRDPGAIDFIRVKRPIEYRGLVQEVVEYRRSNKGVYGFLWSSNNSLAVDDEFWRLNELRRSDEEYNTDDARWARKVLKVALECSYGDGTGEPGFLNVHRLSKNNEGLDKIKPHDLVGSDKYTIGEDTEVLMSALLKRARRKKYNMIVNPCSEIVLNVMGGYCVSGETRILHRGGYDRIKDLVGQEVEVFNGEDWSTVKPFKTGENQTLVRVTTSDGSTLDCTPYHRFSVRKHRQSEDFVVREAKDLRPGDVLPDFRVKGITGESVPNAYTYGAFLGDGSVSMCGDRGGRRYHVTLYRGKHHLPVVGARYPEKKNGGIIVNVGEHDRDRLESLKSDRLPDWVFAMDRESTIAFLRGWIDTDGTLSMGGFAIANEHEEVARGLQLLLRRVGLSYSSVKQVAEVGDETNFGPRTHGLWVVRVQASEAAMLNGSRVRTDHALELDKRVKHPRVVSVEEIDGEHDTFCFTEPLRGMGVFGNMLTHQCVIADVVPYHADTLEEAEDAFRTATRALIRVNLMNSMYDAESRRTNRIGVGMTGVHEFAWKFFRVGFRDLVNPADVTGLIQDLKAVSSSGMGPVPMWDLVQNERFTPAERAGMFWWTLERFNAAVNDEAERYSKELGVAVPHTTTTIKPAGTTSKLFGLTEGWHLPSMRAYLRWVQFRDDDPLVEAYRLSGYPTKKLRTYEGTTIVGFPTAPVLVSIMPEEHIVTAAEATPEQQYRWLQLGEQYYIRGDYPERGNQISYTLHYDPEKVSFEDYSAMVRKYQSTVSCCSVMPRADDNSYEYTPEQSITKAEYESLLTSINAMKEDVDKAHVDCASGACPIDFSKATTHAMA